MKTIKLTSPAEMSAAVRAAEITRILAAAILRTHRENTEKQRETELGFWSPQSVHTTPSNAEKSS